MSPDAASRSRRRAVVVERHVLQRQAAVRSLSEHAQLQVVHACDSITALMAWMREQDRRRWPHLVVAEVLPLLHPERDLRAIAALRRAGVRLLLLSTLAPTWRARRLIESGLDGVVSKVDTEETFLAAVAGVLAGRRVVTDAASAATAVDPLVPRLSMQESRVLELYVAGSPISAVADMIGVKEDTARKYLNRIKQKYTALGRPARSKLDLARLAWQDGIIDPRITDPHMTAAGA